MHAHSPTFTLSLTYTLTHSPAPTLALSHSHTRTHVPLCIRKHTHTLTHTHTHIRAYTHNCTHMPAQSHLHARTIALARPHNRTCTHIYTHTRTFYTRIHGHMQIVKYFYYYIHYACETFREWEVSRVYLMHSFYRWTLSNWPISALSGVLSALV